MSQTSKAEKQLVKFISKTTWKKDWKRNKVVYFLFIPLFIYFFVLNYLPMFGLVMAFQDFNIIKGVFGSNWAGMAGFANFHELFTGGAFLPALRNTAIMALLGLTLGFVAPVGFALLISSLKFKGYKKVVQVTSYMPNFVATVVVVSLVTEFLGIDGAITGILTAFGLEEQNWLANPNPPVFWLINCFTDIWQGFGYGSIIYVAAIANVNSDLHEAAAIDGANRWTRTWRIIIPSIMPMLVMMFTLRIGTVFKVGFDKILLLYSPTTYTTADCLYTYTYRMAFGKFPDFGVGAASGLFQSILSMVLLVGANKLSRVLVKTSLY